MTAQLVLTNPKKTETVRERPAQAAGRKGGERVKRPFWTVKDTILIFVRIVSGIVGALLCLKLLGII